MIRLPQKKKMWLDLHFTIHFDISEEAISRTKGENGHVISDGAFKGRI